MDIRLLLPGAGLALAGVALTASFSFVGPELPSSLPSLAGWALLLVGLGLMRLGAGR